MENYTLNHALETAVMAEDLGIKYYSEMAKRFSHNDDLKNMFQLLAKDEVEHKKQFTELLKSVPQKNPTQFATEFQFLQAVDLSKFFKDMENVKDEYKIEEVLQGAFNFEKESVLFYIGIRDLFGEHPLLDEIINLEKNHMTKLMKYIVTGSEFRGISDKEV